MHGASPALMRWRAEWHGWREFAFPDAVTDSNRRRSVAARRRERTIRRVRQEAIRRGAAPGLVMVTVGVPGNLYDLEAHRAARAQVKELVGGWPAWFTLESGRSSGLHAHVLTTVEAVPHILRTAPEAHGVPVWSMRGVLAYLSKPRDARAARSNERRTLSLSDVIDAAEDYLQARAAAAADGRERLPVGSGVVNTPNARRDRHGEARLLLACLSVMLQAEEARLLAYAEMVQKRRERRRERLTGPKRRERRARHAHGDLVGGARRFCCDLHGHARPPPRIRPRAPKPLGKHAATPDTQHWMMP